MRTAAQATRVSPGSTIDSASGLPLRAMQARGRPSRHTLFRSEGVARTGGRPSHGLVLHSPRSFYLPRFSHLNLRRETRRTMRRPRLLLRPLLAASASTRVQMQTK